MKKLSIGLVALTLVLAGCGGSGEKADAANEAAADVGAAAAGSVATGVAECDEYLNKVMACIDSKIPEAQRAAVRAGIDASKKSWEAVPDKTALAGTCKMAMDQAKSAYSAMGCTF